MFGSGISVGTVYFMDWIHGLESWIGSWSGVLEWILMV